MPTFIDESGCCGFEQHSQPYFRLVAVWFPTAEAADACREAIENHRNARKLPEKDEFKYSNRMKDESRAAFFTAVAGQDFRFVATHFDKKLARPGSVDKAGLYRACISAISTHLLAPYQGAERAKCEAKGSPVRLAEKVIPDDNEDAFYLKLLKEHFFGLKSEAGKSLVSDVKAAKSKAHRLLQLADMICGAVGDSLAGERRFFNLISGKCLQIVRLPETQEAAGENTSRPV